MGKVGGWEGGVKKVEGKKVEGKKVEGRRSKVRRSKVEGPCTDRPVPRTFDFRPSTYLLSTFDL